MNQLYFIRSTIYQLKREYGTFGTLKRYTTTVTNDLSGTKTRTSVDYNIKKIIRLPQNAVRSNFYKMFHKIPSGDDAITRDFLIDGRDIEIDPKPGDELTFPGDSQRYIIKKCEQLDLKVGYFITATVV